MFLCNPVALVPSEPLPNISSGSASFTAASSPLHKPQLEVMNSLRPAPKLYAPDANPARASQDGWSATTRPTSMLKALECLVCQPCKAATFNGQLEFSTEASLVLSSILPASDTMQNCC